MSEAYFADEVFAGGRELDVFGEGDLVVHDGLQQRDLVAVDEGRSAGEQLVPDQRTAT